MKVTAYICDRCGETVPEDDITRVSFSHGRGKFDLRDEEFELCPACDEAIVAGLKKKLKETRPDVGNSPRR